MAPRLASPPRDTKAQQPMAQRTQTPPLERSAPARLTAMQPALLRTRHGFERRASFQPRDPIHLLVPVAESQVIYSVTVISR
jgi:hypothetical protein